MARARSPVALAIVVGAASVLLVLAGSGTGPSTGRPALHGAVEAVVAVVAALAAVLAAARAYWTRHLDDFVLATAFGVLAGAQLAFAMVPAAFGDRSHIWVWSLSAARLEGAILLAVAGFAPPTPLRRARRAFVALAIAAALVLVAIGVGFAAASGVLPKGETAARELEGQTGVYALHAATLLAFALATLAFGRRWQRERRAQPDRVPLAGWITTAAALAAMTRFDYLLDPSTGLNAVRPGDVLRVVFYMIVVLGLVRDAASRAAEDAAHRERRRIARDLHDGIAQELAFIVRRARAADETGELAAAAERALAESRRAIDALRRPMTEPLDVTLAAALNGLGARVGTRLVLDLEPVTGVSPDERDALAAIAREAVENAARHAHAGLVRVELSQSGRVQLRVADDGVGFDPAAVGNGSYGIVGMRERAEGVGAHFRLESGPGEGTAVEVVLP